MSVEICSTLSGKLVRETPNFWSSIVVDFKKRLTGKATVKPADPIEIYQRLDRASDKGPLRPAQEIVLKSWFEQYQEKRDVVLKLHTGQGKTLIGLLMLQSQLHQEKGPAVYLCPDNYLIKQTCSQAKQFGIKTCISDGDLPDAFLNSSAILVTSVQKMFNGFTKFGLNNRSLDVGSVLMDDCHACADRIRDACKIRIPKQYSAYLGLRTLFSASLEAQGVGTFAEIENGSRDAVLPVPYWDVAGREGDIAKILLLDVERKSIKFAWPLLKDRLSHCQYTVSGEAIEIEPFIAPLEMFGSYANARHRIFMSATVTDDSFLIKGLQLKPTTIANPLVYEKETWSGEKMILLPSLIDYSLNRSAVVQAFGKKNINRTSGVVALSPSVAKTGDWKNHGSIVASKETLEMSIQNLKAGNYKDTLVLVNRYDGIDLPDDSCRILIFDSKPFSENLVDVYQEHCRPNSQSTLMRAVRSIEQGMGRSVRGEKDYSVILIIGPDLIRLVRDPLAKEFLSPQMSTQIEIGLEISEYAQDDISSGENPEDVFYKLIDQCLSRDDNWKEYYLDRMDDVSPKGANLDALEIFEVELIAEQHALKGRGREASDLIQKLLDDGKVVSNDKGWYLQECARHLHASSRGDSNTLQIAAHNAERLLLKPATGVAVSKLSPISQTRVEGVIDWVRQKNDYEGLNNAVSDILDRLVFGVKADKFEQALDELGKALGFASERPDKEWKEGPDNLWALNDSQYLLIECKNEVLIDRVDINKGESDQMNRSSTWFEKHYAGMKAKRIIVHPASNVSSASAFSCSVEGVNQADLKRLVKACREFFNSFKDQEFKDLSIRHVQNMIEFHKITVDDLLVKSVSNGYSRKLKDLKR